MADAVVVTAGFTILDTSSFKPIMRIDLYRHFVQHYVHIMNPIFSISRWNAL